jgi:ubiquinone/menaquinone biosynthesis C-methylase UbiE
MQRKKADSKYGKSLKQNKKAEMNFSELELTHGVWNDSEQQTAYRREQLKQLASLLLPKKLVLDAGCGPGTYGLIIADEKYCDVIGVDISVGNAKLAIARAKRQRCSFSPVVADLERLPFRNGSFDICLCAYILHHFPNISVPLRDIARVTKQEGNAVVLEPNGSNPVMLLSGRLEDLIRELLSRLGLDSPNENNFGLDDYSNQLLKQGFTGITVASHYYGGLPPLPDKSGKKALGSISVYLVLFFVNVRRLLFLVCNKLLPPPINGADLVIVGTKRN